MDGSYMDEMDDFTLLIGRCLLAFLFLVSGLQKFWNIPDLSAYLDSLGLPAPTMLTWLMALCEIVGGLALVIGFQIRAISILFATWCVVTAVVVHIHEPSILMKNLALAGGFLVLAGSGPGGISYYGNWPERHVRGTSA
ncbi:MAG TPA: DoxX family protein [Mesorhizobium sp.]|jgi:putative oxidoreductase|uniref:DoxX family protein n=1 Tax=Mesorhizobium sp. TaxID=1871066 RepID=UPI002DDCE3A2|nr:DoxX family protein [Mesorhizobium sp.]HEV2505962.1 DoxX family protein [Mesorhizobium sp.]